MSSALKRSLQHRMYRCPTEARHQSNEVSTAEKLSWKSSASEVPMPHRSNASEDPMVPRQLSEGSTTTIQAQCDRKFRRPPSEVPMPTQKKGTTATQCLVRVGGLYKRLTPAIFKLLEFRDATPTLEKFSKTTKELLDQILRFNTSCESVSARLALE